MDSNVYLTRLDDAWVNLVGIKMAMFSMTWLTMDALRPVVSFDDLDAQVLRPAPIPQLRATPSTLY